jgi:hypothetical protein
MDNELTLQWISARNLRNRLLGETDYQVLRFIENGAVIPNALKQYRQVLRDIPETFVDPADIVWPTLNQ